MHVLVASGAGSGRFEDDAALAGAVAILRRRARVEIRATTQAPDGASTSQPEVAAVAPRDLASALDDCELLCIAGTLATPDDIERAALHVAAAHMAGVPAALLALCVPPCGDAAARALLEEIVAGAESASAADAETAALLGAVRGRRVEIACPVELCVSIPASPKDSGAIAVSSALLDEPAAAAVISTALGELGCGEIFVLGRQPRVSPAGPVVNVCTTWEDVRRALAVSEVVLGGADPALHALALAGRATPVALLDARSAMSSVHARLGLQALVYRLGASTEPFGAVLQRARAADAGSIARHAAPLRTLVHRALGALAEATRARPFAPRAAHGATRAVLARAAARLALPALERGDAAAAEAVLEPWRSLLGSEPAWALARERSWALLGRDGEACAALEQSLAKYPEDPACLAALGRARTRRGDMAGARAAWETLARFTPDSALPHAELATIELLGGRVESALRHWADALGREPGHECVRSVRACLDADPIAQVRFWRMLVDERPQVADFWHALGLAAGRAGDWEAAEAHLQHAASLAPAAATIWEALGDAVARRDAERAGPILARARALAAVPVPVPVAGQAPAGV